MKKQLSHFFTLFFASLLINFTANAQGSESNDWSLGVGVDYFWGGRTLNFTQGQVKIANSPMYKFSLMRNTSFGNSLGFEYSIAPTKISFNPNSSGGSNYNKENSDLGVNFIEFKSRQNFGGGNVVAPYIDGGLGVAIYNIKAEGVKDATKFVFGLGAGSEFNISDNFSININGGFKMPVFGGGPGLYCGIGGYSGVNCGLSFSGSSLITHGMLGGGMTFSF